MESNEIKSNLTNALVLMSKNIGAGLATIGLTGAGAGAGLIFASLVFSLSRNPRLEKLYFRYSLLTFALTEAVGLLALLMAFLILFA